MAVLNTLTAKLLKFAKRTTRQESVRRPTPEENILRALQRVEPYVVWLQSILIWEKPLQTLFTYFCFNVLFWLAVSLNFRFYFLLFSTTCVVLIYEMWADKVWPEIRVPLPAEQGDKEDWTPLHPRVLSAPELSHYLKKGMQYAHQQYIWLQSLRSNQPGVFCALVSIVCIVLMWIGSSVSGTMLLYLIFMLLLLIPGICIHILPSVSQLAHLEQMKSKDDESDVDEYLPEQSGSNMVFLERAVEPDNSDHEEEEDFIPSTEILHLDDMCDSGAPSLTFVHGIKDMPAHEDLSLDSTDFGLEISHSNEDKAPSAQPGRNKRTLDLDINSSDSDGSISPPESETAGFRFKNRHFKGDSSSEEENVPSRNSGPKSKAESGGKGSSGAVADAAAAVLSYSSAGAINLASLGASVGQSLIASVISNAASAPISHSVPVKEEDEEDDALSDVEGFEVISEEEFANL